MDWRRIGFLKYSAAATLMCAVAVQAADRPLIKAMEWLSPPQYLAALTTQPPRASIDRDQQTIAGEVLFHAPTILGGQAAKAGLSCASCHENGRGNPAFLFPNLSDAPGTADVTSSFFSAHRGNATFDPVPIPDLTLPGKISRSADNKDLEQFIRDLIVEEFDGQEPSASTLDALARYIRSLRKPEVEERVPLTADDHFSDVAQAVQAARVAQKQDDPDLSQLLLAAARHRLGLVHERFAGKRLKRERKAIVIASRDLGKIQYNPDKDAFLEELKKWQMTFSGVQKLGQEKQHLSLYNPQILSAALAQSKR